MSKRFGRNQKRKLIADRDGLAAQLKHEAERVSLLQYSMRRNADTVNLVAEILGPNFCGLPAQTIPVGHIPESYRVPARRRAPTMMDAMYSPEKPEAIEQYLLEVFPCQSEAEQQYVRDMVHFYFKTPSCHVVYALEGRVWREQRGPEFRRRLIEEIATSMADHILHNGVRNEKAGR